MKVAVVIGLCLASSAAFADDCGQILRTHGFLSRAQFQCGFKDYDAALMASAKACSAETPPAEAKKALLSGMENFDSNERQAGHAKVCSYLESKYPAFRSN